jgi:hypothetical protein
VPTDLLDVFKAELAARAGSFEPRDIALSAWALATLNPQPDRFETRFDNASGGDGVVDVTTVAIGKSLNGDSKPSRWGAVQLLNSVYP